MFLLPLKALGHLRHPVFLQLFLILHVGPMGPIHQQPVTKKGKVKTH